MRKTILIILVLTLLCSCNNSEASFSSEEPQKLSAVVKVLNDSEGKYSRFNNKAYPEIDITSGSNAIDTYTTYTSNSSYFFCDGIYLDDSPTLLKASQALSYDNSFSSLTVNVVPKEFASEDYLSRYDGTYENIYGDQLVVKDREMTFSVTVKDDLRITVKTSKAFNATESSNKPHGMYGPYFDKLYIDDNLFNDEDSRYRYDITNQYVYEKNIDVINNIPFDNDVYPSYIEFSLTKLSIDLGFLWQPIRKYFLEQRDITLTKSEYTLLWEYKLLFTKNNDAFIDYDL